MSIHSNTGTKSLDQPKIFWDLQKDKAKELDLEIETCLFWQTIVNQLLLEVLKDKKCIFLKIVSFVIGYQKVPTNLKCFRSKGDFILATVTMTTTIVSY